MGILRGLGGLCDINGDAGAQLHSNNSEEAYGIELHPWSSCSYALASGYVTNDGAIA